jgi:integrase
LAAKASAPPKIDNIDNFIFAVSRKRRTCSWTVNMTALRKQMPKGTEHFTFHDLRRTAKSLMSRAKVEPWVSERVLGHVIKGVEGVYDRHDWTEEMADALEKLAGLIERILDPNSNVVKLRA